MPVLREPSSTMQAVCAVRVDNKMADPVAEDILQYLPEARSFRDHLDTLSHGMFTRTIVMRSKFFAEALQRHRATCSQLVILCSGLDFRFLNYPEWNRVPTFLIDHLSSLMLTKKLTERHQEALAHARMVPVDLVDLSKETVAKQLALNGFDPSLPTLFLWEGATYYFQPAVVDQILATASSLCEKSTLVVDFANEGSFMQKMNQPSIVSSDELAGVNEAMALLQKKREPWYGFFNTGHVQSHLNAVGYGSVKIQWDTALEKEVFGDQKMVPESMFYVQASKP